MARPTKPKFRVGSLAIINRAGFPGMTIGTPIKVISVTKGKKRDGYAHRYEIVADGGVHLWVYESDIV